MRTCSYCGAEYPDDIFECPSDHTPLVAAASSPETPATSDPQRPLYEFAPLTPEDREKDFVTLMTCETLVIADMVASRLRAAGIETFIPDENLMQTIGFNLNTFGYVRIQIAPKDYEKAKEVLEEGKPDEGGVRR